jgi:hypothetical protein
MMWFYEDDAINIVFRYFEAQPQESIANAVDRMEERYQNILLDTQGRQAHAMKVLREAEKRGGPPRSSLIRVPQIQQAKIRQARFQRFAELEVLREDKRRSIEKLEVHREKLIKELSGLPQVEVAKVFRKDKKRSRGCPERVNCSRCGKKFYRCGRKKMFQVLRLRAERGTADEAKGPSAEEGTSFKHPAL